MYDFSMPLFPGQRPCSNRHNDNCRKIPVFGKSCYPSCSPPSGSQTVRLTNPQNPCESVTVLLEIDSCGNLVVCVRR